MATCHLLIHEVELQQAGEAWWTAGRCVGSLGSARRPLPSHPTSAPTDAEAGDPYSVSPDTRFPCIDRGSFVAHWDPSRTGCYGPRDVAVGTRVRTWHKNSEETSCLLLLAKSHWEQRNELTARIISPGERHC